MDLPQVTTSHLTGVLLAFVLAAGQEPEYAVLVRFSSILQCCLMFGAIAPDKQRRNHSGVRVRTSWYLNQVLVLASHELFYRYPYRCEHDKVWYLVPATWYLVPRKDDDDSIMVHGLKFATIRTLL